MKTAVRAAIVMPVTYALTTQFVGGNHAPIFAAFGSFALLAMVDFSGRTPVRLAAYLGLAVAGAAMITIGTLCSGYVLLSTLVAGTMTFAISFAGVINGYLAAARIAAVLLIVLPIMIPAGPSAIDDRLLGWAIACAIAIPSIFLVWREPWARPLHKGCADACRALADLVESPDDEDLLKAAMAEVVSVRKQFFKTPHRPTGATGSAAAVAALIEELAWIVSIFWRPGPSIGELGDEGAAVCRACATVLRDTADQVTRRQGLVLVDEIEERREALIGAFTRGGRRAPSPRRNCGRTSIALSGCDCSPSRSARPPVSAMSPRARCRLRERWGSAGTGSSARDADVPSPPVICWSSMPTPGRPGSETVFVVRSASPWRSSSRTSSTRRTRSGWCSAPSQCSGRTPSEPRGASFRLWSARRSESRSAAGSASWSDP